MPLDVSVVVPVWNAGPNLVDCLDSLLQQTLAQRRYEVVLVDDGSTDGTGERLDEAAAAHPELLRVLHIPASGWPGRPRNVGVAAARGEYVQFVDSDDRLAPSALERLLGLATRSAADVVLGKLSSDFRGLNPAVFRENLVRRTLADSPVVDSLTPHKMFRRAFLLEHDIRSPEGPRDLEDQLLVMRAYVAARSIAVLADLPCYFYQRRRGGGRNLGDVYLEPSRYFACLGDVLDVLDAAVPPGELRDRLTRRFYRVEMLGRLRGPAMLRYEDSYRREIAGYVRRLAVQRMSPGVAAGLGAALRAQSRLVLDDDLPGLVDLAREQEKVRLVPRAPTAVRWHGERLLLEVDAVLEHRGRPLRLVPSPLGWCLPVSIGGDVPEVDRLLGPESEGEGELALVDRATAVRWSVREGLQVRVGRAPDAPTVGGQETPVVRVVGEVGLDLRSAAGGQPLSPGIWDLRVCLTFAGLSRRAPLLPDAAVPAGVLADGTFVVPYRTKEADALALDVGSWATPVAEELAGSAELTLTGHRLLVRLAAHVPDDGPRVELLLAPEGNTSGGLRVLVGQLGRGGVVATRLPRRPPAGSWQVWLRLDELGGAPPAPLPWRIHASRGRWLAERVNDQEAGARSA